MLHIFCLSDHSHFEDELSFCGFYYFLFPESAYFDYSMEILKWHLFCLLLFMRREFLNLLFFKKQYHALMYIVFEIEKQIVTGELGSVKIDQEYKFFTQLFLYLIGIKQEWGSDIKSEVHYLKRWLRVDYGYERKIAGSLFNGIAQMLSISIILTLFFWLFTQELKMDKFSFTSLWLIHASGIAFFCFFYIVLRKYTFALFSYLFYLLLGLRSRISLGGECYSYFKELRVESFLQLKRSHFDTIVLYLQEILKKVHDTGDISTEYIDDALLECEEVFKQRHILFNQQLSILKFFILAIFFLGSYLYYLVLLMNSMSITY